MIHGGCVVHSRGSVVGDGSSHLGDHGGGDLGNHRGGNLGDNGSSLLADNGVESVDGISGVVNDTTGSVSLGERVRSLHGVAIAGLALLVVVSTDGIVHGVGVGVLRVGIERFRSLGSDHRGGNLGDHRAVLHYSSNK
ncbi:hypothetical protein B566_EDAN012530 [Ephemera danica]|nr:hypothetical protein B566_EDAN012530 [Ephemera danica]